MLRISAKALLSASRLLRSEFNRLALILEARPALVARISAKSCNKCSGQDSRSCEEGAHRFYFLLLHLVHLDRPLALSSRRDLFAFQVF